MTIPLDPLSPQIEVSLPFRAADKTPFAVVQPIFVWNQTAKTISLYESRTFRANYCQQGPGGMSQTAMLIDLTQ